MSDQAMRRILLADERRQRIWALFNAGRMSEDRATVRLMRRDEAARARRWRTNCGGVCAAVIASLHDRSS